jgi:D-beta-D-heptose 7-phosphate kinase/D-beta-D-heptose 1-phosphate adenosyltransferase
MSTPLNDLYRLDMKGEKVNIGVLGDAMLDEYFTVKVKKISPEFPIPVMYSEHADPEALPGGAANVAYQFKYWNVNAHLLSFLDDRADNIFRMNHGLNTSLSVVDNRLQVPLKKRFYSDDFPTYRWDVEKPHYGQWNLEQHCYDLHQKAMKYADKFQAVIFSDYDKGVFGHYQEMLIPEVPISIVDPKGKNIDKWRGCTVFKPNAAEALALSGRKNVQDAGLALRDRLQCPNVVITEGAKGVTLVRKCVTEIRPTETLPLAESVIGAGDCFVSFLALALVRGMDMESAVRAAWEAGTLYVRNRHNKPVSRLDVARKYDPTAGKILSCVAELPPKNFKLVFTNGCFDVLHAGHMELLKFAKSKGDKLLVAVNSDASVAGLKKGRPIIPLEDRMQMLACLEMVDFVIPFDEPDPLNLIQAVKPDVLVKGGEYQKEKVVGYGIVPEVEICPMVWGLSTTGIVEKIKATD